jgi:hypothetical protein
VAAEQGRTVRAARLLGAAVATRERLPGVVRTWDVWERDVRDLCRQALGEEPFLAAWDEGCVLSLESALTLALEQTARDVGAV